MDLEKEKNNIIVIDINNNKRIIEINSNYFSTSCINNIKKIIINDTENKLNELICFLNNLEELIIIGGKNIKNIECWGNKLKELDLSMCEKLQRLWCDFELEQNLKLPDNELTLLDFDGE